MVRQSIFVGDKFNFLTVEEDLGVFNKNRKFRCSCDCGCIVEVIGNNLKKGNTKSCGCIVSEIQARKWQSAYEKRGFGKKDQSTPEYLAWRNMQSRCYNPSDISYSNYGGKGITVCSRWLESFENFIEDVGLKPYNHYSLDRQDVTKPYEVGNVFWKDLRWQARNKGKIKNSSSKFKGVSLENGKWRSRIKDSEGLPVHLGSFLNEVDAARAVDDFLMREFGSDCPWTNLKLGLIKELTDDSE